MSTLLPLLVPLLLIVIGFVLLRVTQRKREQLQMPSGTPIYQDTQ